MVTDLETLQMQRNRKILQIILDVCKNKSSIILELIVVNIPLKNDELKGPKKSTSILFPVKFNCWSNFLSAHDGLRINWNDICCHFLWKYMSVYKTLTRSEADVIKLCDMWNLIIFLKNWVFVDRGFFLCILQIFTFEIQVLLFF